VELDWDRDGGCFSTLLHDAMAAALASNHESMLFDDPADPGA